MRDVLVILCVVLLCGVFAVTACAKSKPKVSDAAAVLEKVRYHRHRTSIEPITEVLIERRDGGVVMIVGGNMNANVEYVLPDGEQVLEQAKQIIFEEKMLKYKRDYKPKARVHDGTSWSFDASFADGRKVSSQGYHAWPKGEGIKRMQELLFGRAEQAMAEAKESEGVALDWIEYMCQGMRMQPVAHVVVKRAEGKIILKTKGTTDSDFREFVLDDKDGEELLQKALDIIKEENMMNYKSSYSLNTSARVLDGDRWSLYARFSDGKSLSSRGRNAYPQGKGLSKIQKLLFDKALELVDAGK